MQLSLFDNSPLPVAPAPKMPIKVIERIGQPPHWIPLGIRTIAITSRLTGHGRHDVIITGVAGSEVTAEDIIRQVAIGVGPRLTLKGGRWRLDCYTNTD